MKQRQMLLRLSAPVLACAAVIQACAAEMPASPYGAVPHAVLKEKASAADDGEGFKRAFYRAILRREADKVGVPFDLADAVMAVESGYDPTQVGASGEIGLMQVMPPTAVMLGFRGEPTSLAFPQTNIHYGVVYLARAVSLANGDICRALMKYRAGHGEEIMTARSVSYCARAKARLAAVASPLAARIVIPQAELDVPIKAPGKAAIAASIARPRIRTSAVSRAFWAAQEARIKAIDMRIEARWRLLAER